MRRDVGRRRRWSASSLLLPGFVVVSTALGLGLMASSLGWLEREDSGWKGVPPGTVAVPAAAVGIPTYTRVRLEHLIDPRSQDLRVVYLPEGSILPDTMVDAREIMGRVLATDKNPGQLFSKEDFFPPGTREGIVAGIPPGKRALRIDARKVNGIVGLGRGDRFDLVATLDFSSQGRTKGIRVEGAGTSQLGSFGSQIRATTIVAGGAVVQPLATRAVAGRNQQLVEEMVIAVDPSEVTALTEALHTGARIDCAPLSGRPVDTSIQATEARAPSGRNGLVRVIETISGGQRWAVAVPHGRGAEAPSGIRLRAGRDDEREGG